MKIASSLHRGLRLALTLLATASLWACSSTPSDPRMASLSLRTSDTLQPVRPTLPSATGARSAEPLGAERGNAVAAPLRPAVTLQAARAAAAAADENGEDAVGAPTDPLNPDRTVNLDDSATAQDLWSRIRKGFSLPELESELVDDHRRWYVARPDYVQRMTDRGSRYLFHVVEEIERRGMPMELALLPFIESAFNPQAMSSARASGMWQFMPATGKDFALKQNLFRDDRRDVLASTRAALDYLQRLHRMFGDWHLALAAYNWGEGNVQRAIARNTRQGLPADYLSLSMPVETRHYVPKLYAVRQIVSQPEAYNLTLTPVDNHPYFVTVPIQRDMDVALAARLAGLPIEEFRALNPSLNKPVILAAGTPQLLLPYDNASLFVHNMKGHKGRLASWTAWLVPRTMHPADAAREVGMSESGLRELNHIPPKMLVKAGSTLLVPRSEQRTQDVSESLADNAMMALAPDVPPLRRLSVKAGARDTVASLARKHKVSPQQLAQWNKVAVGASFRKGQAVVMYVPVSARRTVADASSSSRSQGKDAPARRTSAQASAKTTASSNARSTNKRVTQVARASPSSVSASRGGNARPANKARVRVASAR